MTSKKEATIYIVDDDADDQQLLKEAILSALPHSKIKCFFSGRQLLDHLKEPTAIMPTVDMVFLDINMPLMNGMQTLGAIRELGLLKDVPFTVISTTYNESHQIAMINLGAKDCYTKTKSYPDLLALIEKALSEYL